MPNQSSLACSRLAKPLWASNSSKTLIMGDSIGVMLSNSIPSLAIGGNTTLDLLCMLPLVRSIAAEEVWMLVGLNDLRMGTRPKAVHGWIKSIVEKLRPLRVNVLTIIPILPSRASAEQQHAGMYTIAVNATLLENIRATKSRSTMPIV